MLTFHPYPAPHCLINVKNIDYLPDSIPVLEKSSPFTFSRVEFFEKTSRSAGVIFGQERTFIFRCSNAEN
jgi:hypothetical protein